MTTTGGPNNTGGTGQTGGSNLYNASGATPANSAQNTGGSTRAQGGRKPSSGSAQTGPNRDPSLISPAAAQIAETMFLASLAPKARAAFINNAIQNMDRHIQSDSTFAGLQFLAQAASDGEVDDTELDDFLAEYGLDAEGGDELADLGLSPDTTRNLFAVLSDPATYQPVGG